MSKRVLEKEERRDVMITE